MNPKGEELAHPSASSGLVAGKQPLAGDACQKSSKGSRWVQRCQGSGGQQVAEAQQWGTQRRAAVACT